MHLFKRSIIAAFGLALALSTMGAASAEPLQHPRRAEITARVDHQESRIHDGLRDGKLTVKQAHRLHHKDALVMRHEQRDAKWHGGHISHGEQHALNHRLDHLSRHIGG